MEAEHTPMEVAAARFLCRRDSEVCNVDSDDNWKIYGDEYLSDAREVLKAAGVSELLEALLVLVRRYEHDGVPNDTEGYVQNAKEALAKATGGNHG